MDDERITGIVEHIERARMFLSEALISTSQQQRHRKLIAAVYFCQAFQEIMKSAAESAMTCVTRDEMEDQLLGILPHADLIYIVRIHDFHRITVVPHAGIRMQGPITLTTGNRAGDCISAVLPGGVPTVGAKKGNSRMKLNRPLVSMNGAIHDADSGQYVPLEVILVRFLEGADAALDYFRSVYGTTSPQPNHSP